MQITAGTTSHRSIKQATNAIIRDVIGEINGTPEFLIVGFTPNYQSKRDYENALAKICEESGTKNIIGGIFPGVATSNGLPTTQGCSVMGFKGDEVQIQPPFDYTNVRINPKKGAQKIRKAYESTTKSSKLGFFLTPGPFYQTNAFEQLKVLDTFFAKKFKKMFNLIGRMINRSMGKNGYGSTLFADTILRTLVEGGIKNALGGATIDLDMKYCYQFSGDSVFQNALVGTVFSSDKLSFNNNWTFDKSQHSRDFFLTEFLKSSGYVQKINKKPANEAFLELIDISRDLYDEAFGKLSYASLLYLSALENEYEDYVPFVSVCHPILDGVIATIPEKTLSSNNIKTDFFTQSGTGIQKSALECANNLTNGMTDIRFGIFINCSNRLLIAGDKIDKENKLIEQAVGEDVPFITLYSGGEFSLINQKPIYSAVSIHGFVAGEPTIDTKNVVF
ncbi:MAG: hypothetical protein HGN29_11795 [Asgard group archaeon]|nr:hypothetical protein [Asgard group archaeon]